MMRWAALFLSVAIYCGCGNSSPERTEEEIKLQEELEAQDQPREYKSPDGAFGAKDFASEAREQSDQNTEALEAVDKEAQ